MAETPVPQLHFEGECPDCGGRRVDLPDVLPAIGDDFDWRVRDYDGFRAFLLEELAARFPERSRWTAADVEVALIEALSAVLDQLSDQLDRVTSESTLETARRPESVRRLLSLIGADPVGTRFDGGEAPPAGLDTRTKRHFQEEALERYWLSHPEVMEAARREGPRGIRAQHRMVTVEDYARRLAEHPLVRRAHAWMEWGGSWTVVRVALVPWDERGLDENLAGGPPQEVKDAVDDFHRERRLPLPRWSGHPTIRQVLSIYLDAYRMAGQEVVLQDAVPVGILLGFVITVDDRYFRSEVRRAIEQALGRGPGGFFEPGRLRFSEDLHSSDLFQVLTGLEGVADVCLTRFKRAGRAYPDRTQEGVIPLQGLEVAVCDNDTARPERGFYRLRFSGGRRG